MQQAIDSSFAKFIFLTERPQIHPHAHAPGRSRCGGLATGDLRRGGKSSAVAVGQDDLLHHCHAGHAAHRSVHRRVARAVGIGKEAVVGGAEIGGRDENGVTIPP
jgi:hypothetical protein